MFDFHLHLARLPQPTLLARALLKRGLSFNAIACEPWEWEILQKMEAPLFEGSTRSYGIHPTVAGDVTEADWERLESLTPKVAFKNKFLEGRWNSHATCIETCIFTALATTGALSKFWKTAVIQEKNRISSLVKEPRKFMSRSTVLVATYQSSTRPKP